MAINASMYARQVAGSGSGGMPAAASAADQSTVGSGDGAGAGVSLPHATAEAAPVFRSSAVAEGL